MYSLFLVAFQCSIVGSVVECSPATRAARVRFPDDALFFSFGFLTKILLHKSREYCIEQQFSFWKFLAHCNTYLLFCVIFFIFCFQLCFFFAFFGHTCSAELSVGYDKKMIQQTSRRRRLTFKKGFLARKCCVADTTNKS